MAQYLCQLCQQAHLAGAPCPPRLPTTAYPQNPPVQQQNWYQSSAPPANWAYRPPPNPYTSYYHGQYPPQPTPYQQYAGYPAYNSWQPPP
ncbi:hypothetical protein OHC33_010788 [Knufia fluminis]|uniref:Uncharacterized protein n=1 Tax=Knufia fluminis TaxID=191047 RepID=A0AAN8EF82_9EURO|nr:hypothetical protein OHC33_010788 [Knufia fluminis]